MLALVQRVSGATVEVAQVQCARIELGLLVFVCAMPGDLSDVGSRLLKKLLSLRVFPEVGGGKMTLNLADVNGGLLLVSQFTLAADLSKGSRPGFSAAAAPEVAKPLFENLVLEAKNLHPVVQCGIFGADMQVQLVNDGPVTLWLDVK